MALIHADDIRPAAIEGPIELAKKKGLQVVLSEAYPVGTTDFSAILTKGRAANPDALGVATSAFEDGVAITRQMKALDVNPRMVGLWPAVSLPKLHEVLGRDAEFVCSSPSSPTTAEDLAKHRSSGPGWMPPSTERHAARMCRVPRPIRSYVYPLVPFQASQ